MAKARSKLTQQEKNQIKLVNQLSRSFVKAFPGLKRDPRFKPIRIKDVEETRIVREYRASAKSKNKQNSKV